MRMTADIFFTVWEKENPSGAAVRQGTAPVILRHIQYMPPDMPPSEAMYEEDVLYVQGRRLFTGDDEGPSCTMSEGPSGEILVARATDCWNSIFAWDHHICEEILAGAPLERVMQQGAAFLKYPYVLIDSDMKVLYASAGSPPALRGNGAPEGGREMIPRELVHSLLLDKEFHAAALRLSPFYYYEKLNDTQNYCRNIFINGKYYARLITLLPDGIKTLLPGDEQLFSLFGSRVEQLLAGAFHAKRIAGSDSLHQFCLALMRGEEISRTHLDFALDRAGWHCSDSLIAGSLSFFSGAGWHTQLEYTLPYLVSCVEQTWLHSCAFIWEDQVCFLINLTRSKKTLEKNIAADLAILVRENVCRAGVSTVFEEFTQLPSAVSQARQAVRLGKQLHPQRWYFLFDDYRMAYIRDLLRTHLSGSLFSDPCLRILQNTDKNEGTEYVETLRAYFSSGYNMSAAAQRLYIHRTTFCRRMDRIRELTGLHFSDHERMLELELAVRLAEAD